MRSTVRHSALAAACLLGFVAGAHAHDASDGSAYLFGDWNGSRKTLEDEGIKFNLNYTGEAAHNYSGGDKELTRFSGQAVLEAQLDLDKLWGWHDANFRFTVTNRHGRNLSDDAKLGTLQQVQEVYGRGQTWRLTQLWYSQAYFDRKFDVKLGRMAVGEDFAAFACSFQNLTFCGAQPGNLVGNYWFNYPVSQWGVILKLHTSDNTYVQLGGYQVNPSYLLVKNGIKLNNPAGTTGALIPLEFGWKPVFGDRMDGSYKFGGWYNTSNYPDVYTDIAGGSQAVSDLPFEQRSGAYGGYVNFEQQVTHGTGSNKVSGLRLFMNATQTDRHTATTDRQFIVGAIYTSPFVSRPDDDIGLGIGTTHVNSRVIARERQLNAQIPGSETIGGYEYAAELYYTYKPTGWMTLRPNFQYIKHPGGSSDNANAMVLGLKFNAAF